MRSMDIQTSRGFGDRLSANEIRLDPVAHTPADTKLLIIVDRQEFVRGCLSHWIKSSCREFNVSSVADVVEAASEAALTQAHVVVFRANDAILSQTWLDSQVSWLRANRRDVSIVAIVEPSDSKPVAEIVTRFRLRGYIPTSSSMEVATAVLRLVAAGGTYVPQDCDGETLPLPAAQAPRVSESARIARLTPRECVVLELLERGMSNKIIAYRLSLSQSTVKAHVHNIISKLKVHNRTEAAVASHQFQAPSSTQPAACVTAA